ncbi:MAG: endolytic transglycosylase MltG [Calditrichaeota bacterium]|nr:endolytic transglycosylase MltG [Calditrichota bacterium]
MSGKQKAILVIFFLLPLFIYDIIKYFSFPEDLGMQKDVVEINIPKGITLRAVADTLEANGLVKDASMFVFWVKSLGMERQIPSGRFKIPKGLNYVQLATYFTRTKPEFVSVTLIEGWSTKRILDQLSRSLHLRRTILDSLCRDTTILAKYGIPGKDVTGYLLPDTYVFATGIDEKQVITFLIEQTLNLFRPDSVRKRMQELKLNRHQILTLASIVEGEAVLDKERPLIASVYLNRLRRGMRLQADPTIQFLLPNGPRRLTYRDLQIDSPYNTYRHSGLPPGPINNPGKASVMATLFAAETNYLYFVARGDGSHVFTRTAREHAKAKRQFNKLRRKVYGY